MASHSPSRCCSGVSTRNRSIARLSLLIFGVLNSGTGLVEGKPAGPEWLGTSGVIQWCTAASSAA